MSCVVLVEHIPYDAFLNKPYAGSFTAENLPNAANILDPIRAAARELDTNAQNAYRGYLNEQYINARRIEQGLPSSSPRLPSGIPNLLDVQSLDRAHRALEGLNKNVGAKLSFDSSLNTVDRTWSVRAGEILAADPVAKASYARLQRQGTDVRFINDPNMLEMGLFDPNRNTVTVNMLRHSSADEAASTVVHEALHQNRYFQSGVAPGTQFEEYLAFRNEFLFQNGRRPTLIERQQIINEVVRPLYPQLPNGKLPTVGGW